VRQENRIGVFEPRSGSTALAQGMV